MATASWSTRVRHDSDATYQEWRDEFITQLGTLSAKLTASDTNITPAVGARPGTSTEGGYAVYYLNDSIHATSPIYIRFGFGTSGTATHPRIQMTVGTTTNGSGVLGGTCLSTIDTINGGAAQTSDTVRQSYFCATDGFLGLSWKNGASATEGSAFVCRTVSTAAAISSTGGLAVWGGGSLAQLSRTQAFRYIATAAAYTARTTQVQMAVCLSPQAPASSIIGTDLQVFVAWMMTPAAAPVIGICGIVDGEIAAGNTFTATLVGSTSHTYIKLSSTAGPLGPATLGTVGMPGAAMLWE